MARKSIFGSKEDSLIYCRKCKEKKKSTEFYSAVDNYLDTNGFLSICKSCCNIVYEDQYHTTQNIDTALLGTCRILNISYILSAVDGVKSYIQNSVENNKDIGNVFGVYKKMIATHSRGGLDEKENPLVFNESSNNLIDFSIGSDESLEEMKMFWGNGLVTEDYQFLENELADWKKTHKCDVKSEELLLKEICWKELNIKKERELNHSTAKLVKELQDLMKTAALDPSKINSASVGKSQDAFGVWIKQIEEKTPAEWWQDEGKYKDIDNLKKYAKDYIERPIRNFLGDRDFSIGEEEVETGEEDDSIKESNNTNV